MYYIYTFKLKFNEYWDELKFKSNRKCIAFDYHPETGTFIKPCTKYTYKVYCDNHTYLKRISCKAYHYLHDQRISNVPNNVNAEVELNARQQFCERFVLKMDRGHSIRNEILRGLMYSESYKHVQQE